LSEAKEFLLDELRDGPMAAKQVKKNARDADIAERTLKRAKAELRVSSDRKGDGSWVWSLPLKEAKGGQPSTVGPVGPVGPLEGDGSIDNENTAYLREEGQGGQEGQRLEIGTLEEEIVREPSGTLLPDPEEWEEI